MTPPPPIVHIVRCRDRPLDTRVRNAENQTHTCKWFYVVELGWFVWGDRIFWSVGGGFGAYFMIDVVFF